MAIEMSIKGQKKTMLQLRNAADNMMDSLARAMFKEAEGIMRLSKKKIPVDQGTLRVSGFVRMPVIKKRSLLRSASVTVTMGYGGAAKAYAVFVHEGTGPAVGKPAFMPPVAVFEQWAKRVLGDESLGFVVARSVGQKGLKPRKYLEEPFRLRARGMAGKLAARVRKDVARGV